MPEIRTDIKQSLKEIGRTLADLCRSSGIHYKRLSGAVNGYWNLKYDEEIKIKSIIAEWLDDKQEVYEL